MKINYEQFNSIDKFITTLKNREPNKVFKGVYELESITGSYKFTETENYEDATNLMLNGWDCDYLKDIKEGMEKLSVNGYNNKRRMYNDVVGYTPCVPRAIQGLPDSMYNTRNIRQKVKTVTIFYDCGASGFINSNNLVKAGIKVLAVVNELESQGVKVQLDLGLGTYVDRYRSYENEVSVTRITMKKFRDSLDLKKLVFPIAHPSMLRRIFFRYIETCPSIKNTRYKKGYGAPMANLPNYSMKKIKDAVLKENEFYLDYSEVIDKTPLEILKDNKLIS